jgi:CIC family chloride channel protein
MEGTAGEICTRNVITVCPDESLDEALRQFGSLDVGRIPVVERANSRCVVGMLRRGDIVTPCRTPWSRLRRYPAT